MSIAIISTPIRIFACCTALLSIGMTLTQARAETRVYGCDFIESYSSSQVASAFSEARTVLGSEAVELYRQYIGLKNECRTNPDAKRTVHLSGKMAELAAGH
jgi:hypothetical protein